MGNECYNLIWVSTSYSLGITYLVMGIFAFVIHFVFWLQVITHRALRQISMLWVYNYLFTDMLLIIQLFIEYAMHTSMRNCVSYPLFKISCILEAYTGIYMAILEAYMLVCLNISRYLLIVKNYNLSVRYRLSILIFNGFLYILGLCFYIIQANGLKLIDVHPHYQTLSCHLRYPDIKTQIGNLMIVLIIPIGLNIYFVALTTIHVRQSQQAARSQRKKHVQLLIQFVVLYTFWLLLWAPNVFIYHLSISDYPSQYTRIGSLLSTICDPLIFMFIDRRFLKVWKATYFWMSNGFRRQVHPTTTSNQLNMSMMGT